MNLLMPKHLGPHQHQNYKKAVRKLSEKGFGSGAISDSFLTAFGTQIGALWGTGKKFGAGWEVWRWLSLA